MPASLNKKFKRILNQLRFTIELGAYDCSGISIETDDLKIFNPEESLTNTINILAEEWKSLDKHMVKGERINRYQNSIDRSLAIPKGLNVFALSESQSNELSHPKISSNISKEYFTKLIQIMQKVPTISELDTEFSSNRLELMKLRNLQALNPKDTLYRRNFEFRANYLPLHQNSADSSQFIVIKSIMYYYYYYYYYNYLHLFIKYPIHFNACIFTLQIRIKYATQMLYILYS